MSFDKSESARWAIECDKAAGELYAGVDKALADSASRGFPAPAGDALAVILSIGQGVKDKLAEFNGAKIYEDRRATLFQIEEYRLKILVKLATLAMDLYREQIFNALAIEEAQEHATATRALADVERHNSETELRQKAIIMHRAEAERRIIVYKAQLVKAETTTLTAEAILVNAQLATAEKKLEIIASIYQVLAAEKLVVAAEQRRAASLQKVLAAELIVAGIKKEMVPFYIQKATALEAYAQAIIADLPVEEALIRLGYDRIDLKTTEEYAGHLEREQQEELELLREQFVRSNTAMELIRLQNRRLILEYRNQIQTLIHEQKKALQEDEISFRLATGLAREAIGVNNEVAVTRHEITNLTQELISVLNNLGIRAQDETATITASGNRNEQRGLTTLISEKILEGAI